MAAIWFLSSLGMNPGPQGNFSPIVLTLLLFAGDHHGYAAIASSRSFSELTIWLKALVRRLISSRFDSRRLR